MNRILLLSIALVWSILCTFAQKVYPEPVEWELPAPLTDRPSLIIHHSGYTVSYNTSHGTPNWSAWVLTKAHVQNGTLTRSNQFLADPCVPIAYRVQPSDYNGSGYDRGHMCPCADMQWSTLSMKESFFMTNMCPQVPALNRVYWKQLEDACRKWALTEDTLYIVAGPYYAPNEPIKYLKSPLFQERVRVRLPSGFFKVILSLRKGHQKAIGFLYANSAGKQSLNAVATTVDYIEQVTGIDFFYSLPDSIENALESHFSLKNWH